VVPPAREVREAKALSASTMSTGTMEVRFASPLRLIHPVSPDSTIDHDADDDHSINILTTVTLYTPP
jgi:hypothetical protein